MRIAIVHSFYSSESSSGENQVVESQVDVLRENGHEVFLIASHSDDLLRNRRDFLNAGLRISTGIGRNPLSELRKIQPNITFVHNLHPNFGSHWMSEWDGPIIRVLHNFRLFCAKATFFREGKICQDCIQVSPLQGLKNSCYKDSKVATLPLTLAQIRRVVSNIELESVHKFIALSDSAKSKLIESKIPESRIDVLPNFIRDPYGEKFLSHSKSNGRWIAAGRLSPEKGFVELVEAWPEEYELDIVGHGPSASAIAILVERKPNIRLLGKLDREKLLDLLPHYTGAVFPSLWFEVAPIVAIEFLSAGLPIVANRVSSVSSIVEISQSGKVIEELRTDELVSAIEEVIQRHEEFRQNSRIYFEKNFTSEVWMKRMDILFSEVTTK